ncbi:MAG: Gfo/Idh/MocA family protein [Chthoniobacterales bacterium]
MSSSPPLRIGIIGAGGIVRSRHLPGLRKISGIKISAVANSTLASAEKFIAEESLSEARAYADWREIIDLPDVDIIWIGTTPYMHCEITLAALAAEKHVFCQARMACNGEEAEKMLVAARENPDLVTMLCPPPMGLEKDFFFKKLLAEKKIGALRHLELFSLGNPPAKAASKPHWRQLRKFSGNNVMALGIYVEVLQRWFGRFDSVFAEGHIFESEIGGVTVDIPDQLDVLGDLKTPTGKQICNLRFSNVHIGPPMQLLRLTGSNGTLEFNFSADQIALLSAEGEAGTFESPVEGERPWAVEADFIDAVRNPKNERPHPTFQDGVNYMRVVDAVAQSLQTGQRVEVNNK